MNCVCVLSLFSCLQLCDPMDLLGASVHGIQMADILVCVILFVRSCHVYCRTFSRVTVLYSLDVSTLPGRDNQKRPQALSDVPKKINILIEERARAPEAQNR